MLEVQGNAPRKLVLVWTTMADLSTLVRESIEKALQEQIASVVHREIIQLIIDSPNIRASLERLIEKSLGQALQELEQGSDE
jgi:hypothetical protein